MNVKKIAKWAAYYTAAATVYNYALNSYNAANTSTPLALPLLPNPVLAGVAGLMGASAPLLLTQSTGNYGWG
jgi:hypothetical protein